MMGTLVSSLKRLYDTERITRDQLSERVEKGIIDAEEYQYITGDDYGGSDGNG